MRLKIVVIFSLIALTINGLAQNGFLHANGKKIVDGSGNEVLLRGMGLGGWMLQEGYMLETGDFAGTQHEIKSIIKDLVGSDAMEDFYRAWRANYCTKKDVDSMAAWGFNSIRLPLHYNLFTLPIEDEPVLGKDTWLDEGFLMVDSLLSWCEANRIYLILDLHAAPGGQGKDANISDYDSSKPSLWESAENRRKTVALWKKFAERYANEPWIGGYDLLNEPNWDIDKAGNVNGCSCNQNTALWSMYKEIIKAIRTVDNNHIVILEGNCWGNNYNGLSNLKSFDNNLVLSFHKYWSYNDVASIQGIMTLRDTHNVPIWMGESGENSNTWFTNAIKLAEDNNIGWAWWPYKKIGSVTGTVTIPKTEGYQKILNYWGGSGSKPSVDDATEWLMEMAENMKLDNCIIHPDVIDAMFRQVHDKKAMPFTSNKIPGIVYAVDYDLGANGYAYSDTDTANYRTTTGEYSAWNSGYAYRNDGVDIEACSDAVTNGFNAGWLAKGEWMLYTVDVAADASYSVDIRYAAASSAGKLHFELDGVSISPVVSLAASGGWTSWSTKTIEKVILKKGRHQLKLYVDNDGFNLNYMKFHSPVQIGDVSPDFLQIKTDSEGKNIKLLTNVGFQLASLPSVNDFVLKVNGTEVSISSLSSEDASNQTLNIELEKELFSTDRILLSYSGTSLVSPLNVHYDPFSDREVQNNISFCFILPVKLEAEKFSYNSGFQTETCTDAGAGLNLSYAAKGDYADYNVYVPETGVYNFDYRVASTMTGIFELRLVTDSTSQTLHTVVVASTGGWQAWKTLTKSARLQQGKVKLRIYVVQGEFNLNWFSVPEMTGFADLNQDETNLTASFSHDTRTLQIFNNGFGETKCTVACFDLNGRKILNRSIDFSNNRTVEIDANQFVAGLYIIRFKTSNKTVIQKLRVY